MTSVFRKPHGFLMTALLGVVLGAVNANASTVLFSTLGSEDVYEWGQRATLVGHYIVGGNQAVAMRFNLGAGATVDDATLALINIWGGGTPASVYIESDVPDNSAYPENGGIPGGILTTLTQVGEIPYDGGLVSFTCDAGCELGAGWYWLVATESDPYNSPQGWFLAQTPDAMGITAVNQNGSPIGPWAVTGTGALTAFRIDGTTSPSPSSIPEPSSLLQLGSGLMGVAALARRWKSR